MQSISIRTAQNVNIRYEAASVGERIVAFLIDSIIRILLYMGILSFFESIGIELSTTTIILIGLPFIMYHLLFEIFYNGQSLGKLALNLKVVRVNGYQPSIGGYIIRWLFRALEITAFTGILAAIIIMINGKGQRLGDVAAGTAVVKLQKNVKVQRHQLIRDEPKGYSPVFEEVTQLDDRDVAVIIEALDIYKKTANKGPVLAAENRVKELLTIQADMPTVKFLYTVVKDYNHFTIEM